MSSNQEAISTVPREKSGWWSGVQTSIVKKYRGFKHFFGIHDIDLDHSQARKHGNFYVYPCRICPVSCTEEDATAQQMLFRAEMSLFVLLSFNSIYFFGWWSVLIIPIYTIQRVYKLKMR